MTPEEEDQLIEELDKYLLDIFTPQEIGAWWRNYYKQTPDVRERLARQMLGALKD